MVDRDIIAAKRSENANNIIKTKSQIEEMGYGIENNIIERVDVNCIGHFGNLVTLQIVCKNVWAMSGYNNTANIGFIIKRLVELLDLTQEDGVRLSEIKNVPIRAVYSDSNCSFGSKCVGIGHFMKDRFVLIEDLAKCGLER